MNDDVILLTPRWTSDILNDSREEPLCEFEKDGPDWFLTIRIEDHIYSIPVHDGEPQGEIVEVAPGVKAWAEMHHYGLSKLGSGVWRVTPSLWVPGELHTFLVLCDVPQPAPFVRPLLFSASGERLG